MKTVFVIRHAKSDQSFFGNDFERPLNDRGQADAPVMAKRLLDKNIKIDALISSPALRAKKTAEAFATTLQIPLDKIIFVSALYHAPSEIFYDAIAVLPDDLDVVAIFSHNTGITYFANSLTQTRVDNMPTCAVFAIEVDIVKWKEFGKAKKDFLFFDYPKK